MQGVKFFSKNRAVKIIQKPTVNKSIKSKQRISERKKKKTIRICIWIFLLLYKMSYIPKLMSGVASRANLVALQPSTYSHCTLIGCHLSNTCTQESYVQTVATQCCHLSRHCRFCSSPINR